MVLCSRISFVSATDPSTAVCTGFSRVAIDHDNAVKSPEFLSALSRVGHLTCELNLTQIGPSEHNPVERLH